MYAYLHRAAAVRGRELGDQDMLRALDAARELWPGGLQASDVPLHDLRYTGYVHNDLQVCVGRVPGCVRTCGAISLTDAPIIHHLSVFCLVKYSDCLYNLRMRYAVCTTPNMEVNVERLRTLRIEHVLTLRELAEEAGVSKDTIWRLENAHSEAHPSTIRKLARALGVQPKELVKTGGSDG